MYRPGSYAARLVVRLIGLIHSSQVLEVIDPRTVTVGPKELDRIMADQLGIGQLQVDRRRLLEDGQQFAALLFTFCTTG